MTLPNPNLSDEERFQLAADLLDQAVLWNVLDELVLLLDEEGGEWA